MHITSLLLLVGCSGAPESGTPEPAPPPLPDVLMVVIDTVRTDALRTYGNPRPTSPQLDALASQGVRFDNAVSPGSWTWPAHGSLFTGTWPWEHGAHFAPAELEGASKVSEHLEIAAFSTELPTLAELFAQAGYRTAMLTANPLIGPPGGMERGFETARFCAGDEIVLRKATELLASDDPRPLFLFLNLFGAHAPYELQPVSWVEDRKAELAVGTGAPWLQPFLVNGGKALRLFETPEGSDTSGVISILRGETTVPPEGWELLRDVYEGEVVRVDYSLHQAVTAWDQSGRAGIVAVTSDHGEYLGEHGMVDHGRTLYSQVIDVPLVITAPGRLPAGAVIDTPVSTRELPGTLLELAGVGTPLPSLVPLVSKGSAPGPVLAGAYEDPFFSREVGGPFTRSHRLLRQGELALLLSDDPDGAQPQEARLFDLSTDPGMLRDLASQRPAEVAALKARIDAETGPLVATPGQARDLDEETRKALEAMGYIDKAPDEGSAPP